MRERLISIIKDSLFKHIDKSCNLAENIADDLLENGAVVLPCKVGDVVYFISGIHNSFVRSATVEEIIINGPGVSDLLVTSDSCVTFEDAIDVFYFTREEAEKALKGGEAK